MTPSPPASIFGDKRGELRDFWIPASDGVRLHAVACGHARPLLLFLHGFPECWAAWHRQLLEFGRDHRAVALDLRGYNLSDKPRATASYALPRLVDDLRRALRVLSPDFPAVVIGHDWGGIVAWSLARTDPALLARLVIINAPHPALFARELRHSVRQVLASSYAAFFQLRGAAELALRSFRFAGLRAMVFGATTHPHAFGPELRRVYLAAWRQPGALTAALNYYRNPGALHREAALARHPPVRVPTLVLWGDRDLALRPGNLRGLEALVPALTVRRHPNATHWIVHEQPDWVNHAIREFVPPGATRSERLWA